MKKSMFVLISFSILSFGNAQNCIDFTSSKEFDFDTMFISQDEKLLGKAKVIIKIFSRKKQVKTQTIELENEFMLKSTKSYRYCENNKSYSADIFLESTENDFGDLIVADLNFDGKEDLAVKREEGGNGGPTYNFYIQSKNGQFVLDEFLSNEMSYFPNYLNSKQKTLNVNIRIDSISEENKLYSYSSITKNWSVKKV
jgi:hypothetical protein